MMTAYSILVISYAIALYESVTIPSVALVLYGLYWSTRTVSEWSFLTELVEPEVKTQYKLSRERFRIW
jgi:hypothetical protein